MGKVRNLCGVYIYSNSRVRGQRTVGKATDLGVWAILSFQKKMVFGGNKEASRRYLGGTELGEDGWSRGYNQSDLKEGKRGMPILVF